MVNRKHLFVASCLAMLLFGVVMTVLGSILPSLLKKFALTTIDAGSLFPLLTLGMLAGSLVFGPIVDRYGYKFMMTLCSGLILAGLLLISFTPLFLILRAAVFIIGFGGGVLNGGSNALVADISKTDKGSRLSFLGLFFGLGAFAIPCILGLLIHQVGFEGVLAGVAIGIAFPLVYFLFLQFPAPKQPRSLPFRQGAQLFRHPLFWLMSLIMFFESGMEITMGGWSATYLNQVLNIPENRAVLFLSFFWLGLTGSRLYLGFLLKHKPAPIVFRVFYIIALVGTGLILLSLHTVVTVVGLLLVGFGLAPIFPIILAYLSEHYPDLSGTVIGLAMVLALMGGSIFPYLAGVIGSAFGLRAAFLLMPVAIIMALNLFTIARRYVTIKTPLSNQ